MSVLFEKTPMLTDKPFHYCPGCNHGIIHRLVAECLEESGMGEKIAGVAPVGCSVFAYDYFNCDMLEAAHGRAPAVATGVKRAKPDTLVFTYQGDGDLASIGTAEIVHAAHRGEKIAGVAPVGCSVFAYDYFNCDMLEAAHCRAPAVATGVKRAKPDTLVFTYQGDGDLASIGTAEIVHAAHRGEKIVTIFVNNAIYGMTGGQMAPTTLVGQRTTTSPYGRDEAWCGAPIKMSEMLSTVPGSYYIERCAVNNNANIIKTKKAIKKAFEYEKEGKGFCMIEVLSTCPTNWGLSPVEAMKWLEENMIPYYPLGVYKDKGAEGK